MWFHGPLRSLPDRRGRTRLRGQEWHRTPLLRQRGEMEVAMDWIEQLLHVSPDGGSGALEAVFVAVAAFVIAGVARWRLLRRRRGASGSSKAG